MVRCGLSTVRGCYGEQSYTDLSLGFRVHPPFGSAPPIEISDPLSPMESHTHLAQAVRGCVSRTSAGVEWPKRVARADWDRQQRGVHGGGIVRVLPLSAQRCLAWKKEGIACMSPQLSSLEPSLAPSACTPRLRVVPVTFKRASTGGLVTQRDLSLPFSSQDLFPPLSMACPRRGYRMFISGSDTL
jgi:hypothetical protein